MEKRMKCAAIKKFIFSIVFFNSRIS